MGVSFGGYLAPRAAAFEKRISALVANDGIFDFGVTQLAAIPPDQRESYIAAVQQKDAPELDCKIVEASNKAPAAKWAVDQAGFVMGEATPHATVAKILKFTLSGGIAEQISCPTLVLDAEEDIYLKGQPDVLFEHLTCPKTMICFTRLRVPVRTASAARIVLRTPAFLTGWMTRLVSQANLRHPPPMTQRL
jgi:pimeloyl-ACP methyl ester carboxylesterase